MKRKRNQYAVCLVFLLFFVISLITNAIGPILPDIIRCYHVSLSAAGFLIFSFFIAYGIMSIPAGFLVEKFKEKPVMIAAMFAVMLGSIGYAVHPVYETAIVSLFVIGAGMATLQVAINPLLRVAGGAERFAFNEVVAQLLFGCASFISPQIYSYFVLNLGGSSQSTKSHMFLLSRLTPIALPWVSLYWIFAAIALVMVLVLSMSTFPQGQDTNHEKLGTLHAYLDLARKRLVWLYFLAIFAYVGSEQGTANWLAEYLSRYHNFDPHTMGAEIISWFWGLMTIGCLAGVMLLKVFDSRQILILAASGALVSLSVALFAPGPFVIIAFPAIGFFASVMWPILISLALNSVAEYHGSLAGILATGIVGGAVVPLLIGKVGDAFGLRNGMLLLYVTFVYIFSVGFWARPLISNPTLRIKKIDMSLTA